MNLSYLVLATALIVVAADSDATPGLTDQTEAYCGHEEHDSHEMRQQAASRIYWRKSQSANPQSWKHFKILGFNDFHGQLEPRSLFGRPVGGAAVLAAYLEDESEQVDGKAIIVHAGDHVGASPPVSALLQDEPSITFLNLLSNDHCQAPDDDDVQYKKEEGKSHRRDYEPRFHAKCNIVGTLGNHEFDEGVNEMLRLVYGGLHDDGPFLDPEYDGAHFPYVIANVVDTTTNQTILPPYVIKRIDGMPVAFIGVVLKQTPSIVTPTGVAGVPFLDEADAVNSFIPELKHQGVRAIVVTIHQGTRQSFYSGPTQDNPSSLDGAIGDIVQRLDDEVDIVVSGHAHSFTNALMPNQNGKQILVTQAFSRSTAYADIDVAIDPASRDIVEKSAVIVTTWADEGPGLEPNEEIVELVRTAAATVEPLVNQVIGQTSVAISRDTNPAGESALGNLIADAQRSAMGTDFAFMNPGGIRADLPVGNVTWGDLFTVQPFNNDLVKMELTGSQIVRLLNQQWEGQPYARVLKTSGLKYTWDNNLPTNDRITSVSQADGTPLDPTAIYSVTVNSFIAAGGDNFSVLTEGSNRIVGPVDLDALIAFISTLSQPFDYQIENRIQRLN